MEIMNFGGGSILSSDQVQGMVAEVITKARTSERRSLEQRGSRNQASRAVQTYTSETKVSLKNTLT